MSQMASNYEYEEDEPMDIDTSSIKTPMKGPSTPAIFNKEDKINKLEEQSSSPMNRNQAKINQPSGAKIVKAIRPGIIPNKSVIKPPVQQTPIGLYDDGYEMIDDPFKTRTRIGFDGSATSSSSSISADTVGSSTSSSNVAVVAKCVEEEAEEERQNDEDGIISVDTKTVEVMPPPPMPSQQISPPTSSSSSSGNTDTSSVGSLSPSQQPQPVLANSDSNNISSNNFENEIKPRLDSLEDGEEDESNHVETVSSTVSARAEVEQEQEAEQEQFSSNYNFDADDANMMMEDELNSSNTRTPTNQVFKVTSRHHHNHHVSFDSKPPQVESFDDFDPLKQQSTANVQIMVNDQSVNNIFESIFTNETDFQSFLDVLEKKEINRPEKEPKYSDIARKSLFLPFDLLLQNKNLTPDNYRRLSVIKEKQAEIKSYLTTKTPTSNGNNEPTETPKVVGKLEQHLEEQEEEQLEQEKTETVTEVIEVTEEQQPNDQFNDTASAFAQQQQLNNSIFFDSIFSNDQEFQMFLDVLEKKEVNEESSALRKSPNKYSEFARKSLYILFDPIVEKDKSITPDKAQRLNHLREKQDVIKAYLSEIAEESGENVTSNITTTTATTRTNEPETTTTQTTKDDYFKDDKEIKVDELTINKSALNQHKEQQNTSIRLAETTNYKTGKMEDGADEAAAANANLVDDQEESEERFNDDLIVAAAVSSSKRESSISSSHSFDTATSNPNAHLATPQSNPPSNNSILDLDKITLKSPIDASTNKLLSVDDLETPITKKDDIMTSSTTTSSLEANANALKARMKSIKSQNLERKQQQLMTSSQIGALADDDLTSSTTTPVTSAADQALIGKLQAELQAYKDRERNYLDHIGQIEEENEKFQHIAVEFEQIFHQLVKDKDANENKLRQEIIELTKERDHLQEDVVGIERSFDDLHRRFENLKTKVVEFRKNEENLQKAIESYQQQLEKEKLKYSTLKKHAEEKLESANIEIDKLRKSTGFELQALKAELKRAEIKIGSLELSVQQKDQENSQLTSLLEELLNKVKPNN